MKTQLNETGQNFVDSIKGCGESENLTKSISVGEHTYKVEIRPISGVGCTKDIIGSTSGILCHKAGILPQLHT